MRRALVALSLSAAVVSGSFASFSDAATRSATTPWALKRALANTAQDAAPRAPSAVDRYAPANGCFTLKSAVSGKFVSRSGTGFAATGTAGEPFHFQAFDLGKYLLFASKADFLATAANPAPTQEAKLLAQGYVEGTGDEHLDAVRPPVIAGLTQGMVLGETATAPVTAGIRGDKTTAAAAPSASAEWTLVNAGNGFALQQAYDDGDEATPGPVDAPIAATLTSAADGTLTAAAGALATKAATFTLAPATGCAAWDEGDTQVSGPTATQDTSYEQSKGYVDAHLHLMSFEFLGGKVICGRVWHPYGIKAALTDCPDHGPGGYGAALEDVVSGKTPGSGHATDGYPTFSYWPHYNSLTHQQVYWTWLERSWRGGLRMMTDLLVQNGQLCELYPLKKVTCDEMSTVRLEAQRSRELERFIDAQNGGPGRGWFRIVYDPLQARAVMNEGKLAVLLGIEVSRPLGCREYLGTAGCTAADIDKRLSDVYALGVRQMEMTNKFDNALTGVTGDSGSTGVIVQAGQYKETGHFWEMQTCQLPFGPVQNDMKQYNVVDDGHAEPARDGLFAGVLQMSGGSGAAPVYPAGPHCNAIGLSDLGKVFLDGLVKRGMVFDPDHMSALARQQALDYLTTKHYSGILSSHTWADDANYYRILSMGGVVTPHAGGTEGFLGKWAKLRSKADPRFLYGIGWGSDISGFSGQGAPRNPAAGKGVTYPFTGLGGVTVNKATTGKKTWDFNTSGVDHYGEYVDWVQDVKVLAGAKATQFTQDLENGPEAYLQMWERANGVVGDSCRDDIADLSKSDVKTVKKGMTPGQVLAALGQPHTRIGTAFTYCGARGTVTVSFAKNGTVGKVT